MRQYRAALLKKEFPFLNHLFDAYEGRDRLQPEDIDDIKVKRGDRNLLAKKGNADSYSWSGGGHYDYTKYFIVWSDEEGGHIKELYGAGYSGTGSGDREEWDADTIGEQLFLMGIAPEFIVECFKNDADDNGNGQVTHAWNIFKMKRFDLAIHHQSCIDQAAAALKAEIAAVCKDN